MMRLFAALLGFAALAAVEPSALLRDGTVVSGQPGFTGGSLSLGGSALPFDRMLGVAGVADFPITTMPGALFVTGDRLRGRVLGLKDGTFTLASEQFGAITVPEADLAVLLLAPLLSSRLPLDGVGGVLLANGDRMPGRIASLDAASVGIDNGRRVLTIPRERVAAVVLRPRMPPAQAQQIVRLASGDWVTGQLSAWSPSGFELRAGRGALRCTSSEVVALWQVGAGQRPFSFALDGEVPPQAGVDALPGGRMLAVGKRRFGHGLGIRGVATVTARTDGAAKLIGEVAVREGRALVRIVADGRTVWDSGPLGPGDPPKPFTAVLVGAARVQVQTVAVDATAALVVVGWPTLVH